MKAENLLQVLTAAHLTKFVDAPFTQRGGIMLVAPPASLKSALIKQVGVYPNCAVLSDVNVTQLMRMRNDMAYGTLSTICFPELDKIYQRHDKTAMNVEGILKALVDEGFGAASYEDQRMNVREATCLLICALVPTVYQRHFTEWKDNGFSRRFIWIHYKLADNRAIAEAIHQWKRFDFLGDPLIFAIANQSKIAYTVTEAESRDLEKMLGPWQGCETPLILLKKIVCVLRWRYPKEKDRPLDIVYDVAPAFIKPGAEMELEAIKRPASISKQRDIRWPKESKK